MQLQAETLTGQGLHQQFSIMILLGGLRHVFEECLGIERVGWNGDGGDRGQGNKCRKDRFHGGYLRLSFVKTTGPTLGFGGSGTGKPMAE
jgi:hypothetical protein